MICHTKVGRSFNRSSLKGSINLQTNLQRFDKELR